MVKKKGAISKESGIKPDIITYILSKRGLVKELEIREYLDEKYKKLEKYKNIEKYRIVDQGNVNRHLHYLLEELGCIELTPPVKKGLSNHWNIEKLKNLKQIRKNFPEIKMNNYEKPLMIVLQKSGHSISTFEGLIIYIQLLLSASFFNMYMEADIKMLYPRVKKSYQCVKGFYRYPLMDDVLNKCYSLYINRNQRIEMSKEEFRKRIDEMAREDTECYSPELLLDMWEKRFPGISKESFLKTWEGHPPGKPTEIPEGIYLNIRDEDLERYMNCLVGLNKQEQWDLDTVFYDMLQEHFLIHDMLNNVDTNDEVEFARKTKKILVNYSRHQNDEEKVQLESDYLKFASEIVVKYKQPSIFGKTYNNPDDAYQALEKFYHGEFKSSSLHSK
ncbi:hypothetical protein MSKOL_1835 [Methanosarcina sp. Kolksee]|uniref:hypothetical protein n=1 Tax=Methanosarcina sp. Kolksee TaxID=1434099 RepID=UPI000615D251|nr:hypothetical protein [Methanosarcina sp. Kolksee]AKB47612.1 hypothetical protein MSKOL_1835 [Methanosarcina sp. Kolksee]